MHYPCSATSRVLRTIIGLCFFQWGHEKRDAFHHPYDFVCSVWSDGFHVRRKRWQRGRRIMSILFLLFGFDWEWNGVRLLRRSSPVWHILNVSHYNWVELSKDRSMIHGYQSRSRKAWGRTGSVIYVSQIYICMYSYRVNNHLCRKATAKKIIIMGKQNLMQLDSV